MDEMILDKEALLHYTGESVSSQGVIRRCTDSDKFRYVIYTKRGGMRFNELITPLHEITIL